MGGHRLARVVVEKALVELAVLKGCQYFIFEDKCLKSVPLSQCLVLFGAGGWWWIGSGALCYGAGGR